MQEAKKQQLIRRAEDTVRSAADAAKAMLAQCGYSPEVFARAGLTALMHSPKIMECETLSLQEGAAWLRPARSTARWRIGGHNS